MQFKSKNIDSDPTSELYNIENAKKAIHHLLQSDIIKQSCRYFNEKINFSASEYDIIQIIKETKFPT
jgi:hypothetical protein